jgi:hypothetical protein
MKFAFYLNAVVLALCASSASGMNFAERCAQPGVIRCTGFETDGDLGGTYGDNFGMFNNYGPCGVGTSCPSIDHLFVASGSGSLKFTVPAGQVGGAAGQWFTNFSEDLSILFGESAEFYVQFRVRMSQEIIDGGNNKITIIGTGDVPGCRSNETATGYCASSCTGPDVVIQTPYDWYKYPTMYNSCTGSSSHGPYEPLMEPLLDGDYKAQNARLAPYCTYVQTINGKQFPPTGNCFGYFPWEWMTFQVHVKTGVKVGDEYINSTIEMWMARDGEPSEPVISKTGWPYSAGSPNERIGKIWFTPYSGGATFPQESSIWYDDLIISRNKIPDGDKGQNGGPLIDSQAPTASVVSPGNSTMVKILK